MHGEELCARAKTAQQKPGGGREKGNRGRASVLSRDKKDLGPDQSVLKILVSLFLNVLIKKLS